MALRDNLKEEEKQCVEVNDYVELAKKALFEPADQEYAIELLEQAEDECKFPNEYVAVAEVYSQIGNKEKAKELYEAAEENAFEPIEFAKIAHSVCVFLNDKQKSFEMFQNAIKDVKKNEEIETILYFIVQDFQSSEFLDSLLMSLISKFKKLEELKKLIIDLRQKSTDINLIKTILKSFEKNVNGIDDLCEFSLIILELLEDKEWAESILNEALEDAKFTKEFLNLAEAFFKIQNIEKVKELIKQAKDFSTSAEENYQIALSLWKFFKDKEQTTELLKKSYSNLKDKKTMFELINFAKSEIENLELAKEILDFTFLKTTAITELQELIKLTNNLFSNKELTREKFIYILEKVNEVGDIIKIAKDCFLVTSDKETTLPFFQKALENASKFEQLIDIAKNYSQLFDADDFLAKILKQSESFAQTTSEFITLGQMFYDTLNDCEEARTKFEKAEEIVASLLDMKQVVESVKKYFNKDGQWVERVEEKLKKREENQKAYEEFQKLEREAKYLKDYLHLANRVFIELNDKYYIKKILNSALSLLDNQYLNIENYYKLGKAIIDYLNDKKWVVNIVDNLYTSRIKFLNDLSELCKFVSDLIPDKEKSKELVEKYLNNWKLKVENHKDAIKLAWIMQENNFNQSEIQDFLKQFVKSASEFPDLYSFLELSLINNFTNFKEQIISKIWNSIKSVNELFELVKLLKRFNFEEEELISKYIEYAEKVSTTRELIELSELYYQLFDQSNALLFFKKIEQRIPKESKEIFDKIKTIIVEQKCV